jgi:Icc protein
MTAILQISDTHIVSEGVLVSSRLNTSDALIRLVSRINSIRDQIGTIDAVLISGDLSDDGCAQSYQRFKTHVSPLDLPIYVIPGNHDGRDTMRSAFTEHLPISGPLNWCHSFNDIVMIGLDTLVEGQGHGTLTFDTLSFLESSLIAAQGSPVLLALHHPPFLSGINFMDKIGLTNRKAFLEIIAGYSGELRIVCGHIHNMIVTSIGKHTSISAPSPGSTFAYDRRADAPVGFLSHEDGCLLHRWDGGFQTIRIGPVAGSGPFAF